MSVPLWCCLIAVCPSMCLSVFFEPSVVMKCAAPHVFSLAFISGVVSPGGAFLVVRAVLLPVGLFPPRWLSFFAGGPLFGGVLRFPLLEWSVLSLASLGCLSRPG